MEETHIVVLGQLEKPPDPSGTLGPQTLWVDCIRQAWQLPFSLLHHAQSQHAQVHRNNAAPHALSLPLPRASWSVARVPLAEQEPNTRRVHDSLLHGKSLLVVAACDLEHVARELGAYAVGSDLGPHAAVHEHAELALIFDFNEFLGAIGGVGYVKLHLDGGWDVKMLGGLRRMVVESQNVFCKGFRL